MSGVIDSNGVQWERCNGCGLFTRLDNLGYQKPSKQYEYGRDLCIECVNKLPQWHLARIRPAKSWIPQRG